MTQYVNISSFYGPHGVCLKGQQTMRTNQDVDHGGRVTTAVVHPQLVLCRMH